MANCNDLFLIFLDEISLLPSKKDRLMNSKAALRKRIIKYFKEYHPEYVPFFFIQGSYKMGSSIRTEDDTCDLDDGVYFLRIPGVSATTLQKWVYDAVAGHTPGGQQHRKKCIRVIYAGDYHIDIPVYYKTDDMEHPMLAVKDTGWEESDPKEFVKWFRDKKDEEGQLVRIIKFLKAWCDSRSFKMPSGLCMTVLAANNICYDERDDVALQKTLKNLQIRVDDIRFVYAIWECVMPTTPKDDLFLKYSDALKVNFLDALNNFIDDADSAINEESKHKASKLWRKHLGYRFPVYEGKETNSNSKLVGLQEPSKIISAGMAFTDRHAKIVCHDTGIKNQYHRNYGGAVYNLNKRTYKLSVNLWQKYTVEKSYDVFSCKIVDRKLICRAEIQPNEFCNKYRVRIEYVSGCAPSVYIESPGIEYHDNIHMYKNGSLCLYFPPDMNWNYRTKLSEYTIPWISEWIIHYEIWKITGKWEGREIPHTRAL